ncbi:MAG TPA: S8 family serine peptidase [Actinoplanes sp.]|nr:S8 family serine peptidase [Actinoplanes sp.]
MRQLTTIIRAAVSAVLLLGAVPEPAGHYWVDQLRLEEAWRISTGEGVTVGVLDTGVNGDHPDLAGAVRPGRAFPDLGIGVRDAHGHGTAVAMLIAGRGRDGATKGVAPGAMILPATSTGTGQTVNEAVHWLVDQGVSVINMSIGRSAPGGSESVALIDEALRYAADHDVVLVAAAGNSGRDTGVVVPASRPQVIAVSAVDQTGRFRADVSVAGPEVAVAAPGVAVVTAVEAEVDGRSAGPDGTSWAAAMVSGVVALARSRYPEANAADIVHLIQETATPAGAPGRDPQFGYGIVDPVGVLTTEVPGFPWWWPAGGVLILVVVVGWAFAVRLRRRAR